MKPLIETETEISTETTAPGQALRKLVTKAVEIDRQIADLEDRLKDCKSQLVEAAATGDYDFAETEGGGRSWIFEGVDGCVARVTQPAAKLKSSIHPEKAAGARILELAGKFKDELFVPRLDYTLTGNFRLRVSALMPAHDAGKLLKLCTTESSPSVSFETKETPKR